MISPQAQFESEIEEKDYSDWLDKLASQQREDEYWESRYRELQFERGNDGIAF